MAKRPSLLGSGRASLVAATGGKPAAAKADPPADSAGRARRPRPEKPLAESIPTVIAATAKAAPSPEPPLDRHAALFAELLSFCGERLRRTVGLAETLGRCRTPIEAAAAQSAFALATVAHYAAESYKLTRMTSTAWGEFWRYLPFPRSHGERRG